MANFDFKTATPATLSTAGFLFGATSQGASTPSIFTAAFTGTGSIVLDGSPTLTTPTLGVATATSVNKVAFTAPASSATLTIANGKTLTASNTLTFAGTDSTTLTFPSTSATIARTDAAQTFSGAQTFAGGTTAAPGIKLGAAQTGLAVDTGTSSQLSLVYAGAEHIRCGFNTVSVIATLGMTISSSNGIAFGASASSSVPRLDPSGTTLRVRLGDGSAYAPLSAELVTVSAGTATPANGSTAARLLFGTTAGFGIYYGSGAPTVSAAQGSLYLRSDGTTTNDRAYINSSGSTTWTALTTAA